ncbi:MAG: GNAT family N-acetyltransferase [Bacteroidota bacterium]
MQVTIRIATTADHRYAAAVCEMMAAAAAVRGTGIAKRQPKYLRSKMQEGKAVIALVDEQLAGFCYIETWEHGRYLANSGLIVHPDFRQLGLARRIKAEIFKLSRSRFPDAKIFGITTSAAVMKINSDLGYRPVSFADLTQDLAFWKGCQSCPNYDILQRTERKMCLCTGMLAEPTEQ